MLRHRQNSIEIVLHVSNVFVLIRTTLRLNCISYGRNNMTKRDYVEGNGNIFADLMESFSGKEP